MRQEIFQAGEGGPPPLEQLQAANLPAILDGKPGISSALELVLFIAGTASSLAGFALLVWRIVRPHVVAFLDARISQVTQRVDQVDTKLETAKTQLEDDDTTDQLLEAVHEVRQQLGRVHRRMDKNANKLEHTHTVLLEHVDESRDYLERATELLGAQGVQLPRMGPTGRESGQ